MTSKVQRLSRQRMKALRLDDTVESAADHADRLVAILQPAAASNPAPDSPAYRSYVHASFYERFMELCRAHPVRARRP